MKKLYLTLASLFLAASLGCPSEESVVTPPPVGQGGAAGHGGTTQTSTSTNTSSAGGLSGVGGSGGEAGLGGNGGFGGIDLCPEGLSACKQNCYELFDTCTDLCECNEECSYDCYHACWVDKHDCKELCVQNCDCGE